MDGADDAVGVLNVSDTLRQCSATGLVIVDGALNIVAMNAEAERFFNCPAAKALKLPLDQLAKPLADVVADCLKTGKNVSDRQIVLPSADCSPHRLRVQAMVMPCPDSQSRGVILTLADQGAVEKLENNIRRLDRLASIGTLAAGMAHEIKNAMVPVKTFLDLLLDQNRDRDLEMADLASKELRRIDSIVSQMLRFSGPAKPSFAPVNVHQVLDQALRLVQHQVKGKGIRVDRLFKAANDRVGADAYQLEQAFLNLYFNAIEAMGPNGVLTVQSGLASHDDLLEIVIADSGVGIPPENMSRLFETFFTTKPNGTGLGLAITRRIVKEHRGEIHVDSHPNQGTIVTLQLPRAS